MVTFCFSAADFCIGAASSASAVSVDFPTGSVFLAAVASVALVFVAPVFLVLVFVVFVVDSQWSLSHRGVVVELEVEQWSTRLVADEAVALAFSLLPSFLCLLRCGNWPPSIDLERNTRSHGCRHSSATVVMSSSSLMSPSLVLPLASPLEHTHLIVCSVRVCPETTPHRTGPRHRLA